MVKSGQTDFQTVAILRWDPATAQNRMDNLLTSTYADGSKVDGVLSPYDGLSIGILSALKSAGYGTAGQPYPIVTGQDAEVASVKSIIAGEQFATIFKDTRELATTAVGDGRRVLQGRGAEVNDTTTYDNGVKVVPTYLLDAGRRLQGQLPEGPDRLRVLHRRPAEVAILATVGCVLVRRAPHRGRRCTEPHSQNDRTVLNMADDHILQMRRSPRSSRA